MRIGAINMAALDWDSCALLSHYYPEDLPPDWRLDYYANEFSVVVVPRDKWLQARDEDLDAWLEAAGDQLGFIFADVETGQRPKLLKRFGERCLGFVDLAPDSADLLSPLELSQNPYISVAVRVRVVTPDVPLKELRAEFERALPAETTASPLLVLLETNQDFAETARSVQILLELMGYGV